MLDGKQRLLSLKRFSADPSDVQFERLPLSGLLVRPDLNGLSLRDLRSDLRFSDDVAAFENQPIRTVIIKNWPNEVFLYQVFLRLNTGSVSLSPQELRQALHPGPFIDFVEEKSRSSQALRAILKNPEPDFCMRDAELLVRYYAFTYFLESYRGNLKEFLDWTCSELNRQWPQQETSIRAEFEHFESAHEAITSVFGDGAYHKWTATGFESRFNRAIFDIMVFAFRDPIHRLALVNVGQPVKNAFIELCKTQSEFMNSIEQTTKSTKATFTRLSMWSEVLKSQFNIEIAVPLLS